MQGDVIKLGTEVVAGASFLHTILPPWEVFDDFPVLQKYYKVLIYTIGYAALNGRSTIYKSVSTKDGTAPSPAVLKSANGQANPATPPAGGD